MNWGGIHCGDYYNDSTMTFNNRNPKVRSDIKTERGMPTESRKVSQPSAARDTAREKGGARKLAQRDATRWKSG